MGLCRSIMMWTRFNPLLYLWKPLFYLYNPYGRASARGEMQFYYTVGRYLFHPYRQRIWIRAVVGAGAVLVYRHLIFLSLVEEVQCDGKVACALIGHAANEPVVGSALLAGYGDVFANLGIGHQSSLPVCRTRLDERQGRMVLIVRVT